MPTEPVYVWSLADLGAFIVHVPFMGFVVLLGLAYLVVLLCVVKWRP